MTTEAFSGPSPRIPWRYRIEEFRRALAERIVDFGLSVMPDSGSIKHARRELEIAGLFSKDSAYGGMLGASTVQLMKLFALQGHSGYSARLQTDLFEKVSRWEPLTPLTGADDEWVKHDYGHEVTYQNTRCSHVFKDADGNAYDITGRVFREPSGACYTSSDSRVPVTFPYTPKTEYVDVDA